MLLNLGIVMVMMTVEMVLMNLQSTAKVKGVLALVICLPVIMETVFLEFTFVMVIMTAWTTVMKTKDINAVSFSYYQ